MKSKRLLLLVLLIFTSCVYQRADMGTDMSVNFPKFNPADSPVVLFDAGHGNFHDINTTYAPFAALLKNAGITLSEHSGAFTDAALDGANLLIIANALSKGSKEGGELSAFTKLEIHIVAEWIQQGGSLLLIADHDPFGAAAAQLSQYMGVGMQSIWTVDTSRVSSEIERKTWLEYNHENGGLGRHSILRGDTPESEVNRVITFTGQSLSYDSTWTSILQLSNSAQNYYTRADASIGSQDSSTYFPIPGQSQLIARQYGEGRIVIAGEAAMFTAQEVRIFMRTIHAGFNFTGYDNKALILNTIHWLLFKLD